MVVEAFRVSRSGTCTGNSEASEKASLLYRNTCTHPRGEPESHGPGGSAEFIITERSTRRVDSDTDGKKNGFVLFGKSVKGRDKVVGNCVFIFRLMILGFAGEIG